MCLCAGMYAYIVTLCVCLCVHLCANSAPSYRSSNKFASWTMVCLGGPSMCARPGIRVRVRAVCIPTLPFRLPCSRGRHGHSYFRCRYFRTHKVAHLMQLMIGEPYEVKALTKVGSCWASNQGTCVCLCGTETFKHNKQIHTASEVCFNNTPDDTPENDEREGPKQRRAYTNKHSDE